MSEVPSEILRDIFLRVPAESLSSVKRVCKHWLGTIEDPSFVKAHSQIYSHTLFVTGSYGWLYSLPLDSINFINNGPQMIDAIHFDPFVRLGCKISWNMYSWRICNGLIFIDQHPNFLIIWNPSTTECRCVQAPEPVILGMEPCYAFGYDCDSDDYKIVKINNYSNMQTFVYSLKWDSWKRIQDCPYHGIYFCTGNRGGINTSFNSTLYWPSRSTIITLNLATETFSELQPPQVDISEFGTSTKFSLDALDGCLICGLHMAKSNTFCSWVRKDESWIQLFSLQYSLPPLSDLWLVAYLKTNEQVILQHKLGFLWFDIHTSYIKKFSIHDRYMMRVLPAKICCANLFRLNAPGNAVDAKARKLLFDSPPKFDASLWKYFPLIPTEESEIKSKRALKKRRMEIHEPSQLYLGNLVLVNVRESAAADAKTRKLLRRAHHGEIFYGLLQKRDGKFYYGTELPTTRRTTGKATKFRLCVRDVGDMCCSDNHSCGGSGNINCLLCKLEDE